MPIAILVKERLHQFCVQPQYGSEIHHAALTTWWNHLLYDILNIASHSIPSFIS